MSAITKADRTILYDPAITNNPEVYNSLDPTTVNSLDTPLKRPRSHSPVNVLNKRQESSSFEEENSAAITIQRKWRSYMSSSMGLSPLEKTFQKHAFPKKVDIFGYPFTDYLIPNENWPDIIEQLRLHLDPNDYPEELLVSVGTERSLMDLLLSGIRAGLVVIDVNPRVKAYIDMNNLLLRIADTREEYLNLVTIPAKTAPRPNIHDDPAEIKEEDLEKKITQIATKVLHSDLPPPLKNYYMSHLRDWSFFYAYKADFLQYPEGYISYHNNDAAFTKLQTYAKAGKIVAITTSINNTPSCLQHYPVKEVDVSNVGDYVMLHPTFLYERMIWTMVPEKRVFSWLAHPLSMPDREELQTLFQRCIGDHENKGTMYILKKKIEPFYSLTDSIDIRDVCPITCYSTKLLSALRMLPSSYCNKDEQPE